MEGLIRKYRVTTENGNQSIDDAFVLRVRSDPAAWLSAWYYAGMTYNANLAGEMRQWLRDNTPSKETLGSEGKTNERLLATIEDTVSTPDALPSE